MHELRKDPLSGRWVVVLDYSLGPEDYETPREETRQEGCVLCPGREGELPSETAAVRPEGSAPGGPGWWARTVPSPRPVLHGEGGLGRKGVGMYDRMNSVGVHELIVESPEHGRQPEDLGSEQMRRVLELYRMRIASIERDATVRYVLVCKNSGRQAGSAFAHPHAVVVATPVIPQHIKEELDGAKQYFAYKERCIFCDILEEELRSGARVIAETEGMVAFCPYAPRFPFEFWIMPRAHRCAFHDMSDEELDDLSEVLTAVRRKMRAALKEPPFNCVIHTAPNRVPRKDHWHTLGEDFHWHMEVVPVLYRPRGIESGAELPVLTTSPEDAAKYIREASYGD